MFYNIVKLFLLIFFLDYILFLKKLKKNVIKINKKIKEKI